MQCLHFLVGIRCWQYVTNLPCHLQIDTIEPILAPPAALQLLDSPENSVSNADDTSYSLSVSVDSPSSWSWNLFSLEEGGLRERREPAEVPPVRAAWETLDESGDIDAVPQDVIRNCVQAAKAACNKGGGQRSMKGHSHF